MYRISNYPAYACRRELADMPIMTCRKCLPTMTYKKKRLSGKVSAMNNVGSISRKGA